MGAVRAGIDTLVFMEIQRTVAGRTLRSKGLTLFAGFITSTAFYTIRDVAWVAGTFTCSFLFEKVPFAGVTDGSASGTGITRRLAVVTTTNTCKSTRRTSIQALATVEIIVFYTCQTIVDLCLALVTGFCTLEAFSSSIDIAIVLRTLDHTFAFFQFLWGFTACTVTSTPIAGLAGTATRLTGEV